MLAGVIDNLNLLMWSKTKDGARGTNRPKQVIDSLKLKENQTNQVSYQTIDEFNEAWKNIIGGQNGN